MKLLSAQCSNLNSDRFRLVVSVYKKKIVKSKRVRVTTQKASPDVLVRSVYIQLEVEHVEV